LRINRFHIRIIALCLYFLPESRGIPQLSSFEFFSFSSFSPEFHFFFRIRPFGDFAQIRRPFFVTFAEKPSFRL